MKVDTPLLLPCPFCGGEAEIWKAHAGRTAFIACMGKCSVLVSKEYTTDAEAITAWNTRTPDTDALVRAAYEDAATILEAKRARLNFEALLHLMRDGPTLPSDAVNALSDWFDAIASEIRARPPASK